MIKMRFILSPAHCLSTESAPTLAVGHGVMAHYPSMMTREYFSVEEVRETVRKYFPETWIWDLVRLE